jgi:hypothetical protein
MGELNSFMNNKSKTTISVSSSVPISENQALKVVHKGAARRKLRGFSHFFSHFCTTFGRSAAFGGALWV